MLQMIGYVTKIEKIKQLGALTASSPLPIVFTEVQGVETFVNDFYIQYRKEDGVMEKVLLTPEIYAQFKGPYNRRNVYGAAIGYAQVLPEEIREAILMYVIENDILKDELGLNLTRDSLSLVIETKTKGRDDIWKYDINCK